MPEAVERHLAHDGDRRGVQEFGDVRAHEGQRRRSRRAPRRRPSAPARCSRRRGGSSPRCHRGRSRRPGRRCPPPRPAAAVSPTAATSGSVKVTCGTAAWSAVAAWAPHGLVVDVGSPFARAAMTVAGGACLVLALVRQQRAVVDVADGVEPVGARARAACRRPSSQSPGSRPTVSSPRSSVRGVRPVATSDLVGVTASPSSSSTSTTPSRGPRRRRWGRRARRRRRAHAARPATSSPANGSSSPSRPLRATSVTSAPSAA